MKKLKSILLVTCLSLTLSSCIFSLFPIYTDSTKHFTTQVVGEWEMGNERIVIEPLAGVEWLNVSVSIEGEPEPEDYIVVDGDTIKDKSRLEKIWADSAVLGAMEELGLDKSYKMSIIEGDDTVGYKMVITTIKDQLFMDLFPLDDDSSFDSPLAYNLIPVHTFLKLEIQDEELIFHNFDLDKMTDLFESNRIRLRHENPEDYILITAQPEEIQRFLIQYASRTDVFEAPEAYRKVAIR